MHEYTMYGYNVWANLEYLQLSLTPRSEEQWIRWIARPTLGRLRGYWSRSWTISGWPKQWQSHSSPNNNRDLPVFSKARLTLQINNATHTSPVCKNCLKSAPQIVASEMESDWSLCCAVGPYNKYWNRLMWRWQDWGLQEAGKKERKFM